MSFLFRTHTLFSIALAVLLSVAPHARADDEPEPPTPEQKAEAERKQREAAVEEKKLSQVEPLMKMKVFPGGKKFDPANYAMAFHEDGSAKELDLIVSWSKPLTRKTRGVTQLRPLTTLRRLEKLTLRKVLTADLAPVSALETLHELKLVELPRVKSLRPIAKLVGLTKLWVERVPRKGLSSIAALKSLEELRLIGMELADLAPLAGLTKLRKLWLGGNSKLTDVALLAKLPNLEEVHLEGTAVTKFEPLLTLKKLKKVSVSANVDTTTLQRIDGLELERH